MKVYEAYNNNPKVKEHFLNRTKEHYKKGHFSKNYSFSLDELYDEDTRETEEMTEGTFCQCITHRDNHEHKEILERMGIPEEIFSFQQSLYIEMDLKVAAKNSVRFMGAIPVGANLYSIVDKFYTWVLNDKELGIIQYSPSEDLKEIMEEILRLFEDKIKGKTIKEKTWKAYLSLAEETLDKMFDDATYNKEHSTIFFFERIINTLDGLKTGESDYNDIEFLLSNLVEIDGYEYPHTPYTLSDDEILNRVQEKFLELISNCEVTKTQKLEQEKMKKIDEKEVLDEILEETVTKVLKTLPEVRQKLHQHHPVLLESVVLDDKLNYYLYKAHQRAYRLYRQDSEKYKELYNEIAPLNPTE